MFSRARLGAREIVAGVALWRCHSSRRAKSWQALRFGDAIAEAVAGAAKWFHKLSYPIDVSAGFLNKHRHVGLFRSFNCACAWLARSWVLLRLGQVALGQLSDSVPYSCNSWKVRLIVRRRRLRVAARGGKVNMTVVHI